MAYAVFFNTLSGPTRILEDSFQPGNIRHGGSDGYVHPGDEFDKAALLSRCPALKTPSAHHPQRSCNDGSASLHGVCQLPVTPG